MTQTLKYRFRVRRRTAADWATLNEVLLDSEFGRETDTNRLKLGDGTTAWNDLPYIISGEFDGLDTIDDGQVPVWDGTNNRWKSGSSGAVWGQITGTLSDQTDLQDALDSAGGGGVTPVPLEDADHTVLRMNFDKDKFDKYFYAGDNRAFRAGVTMPFDQSAVLPFSSDGLGVQVDKNTYLRGFMPAEVPIGTAATLDFWFKLTSLAQGYLAATRISTSAAGGWLVRVESSGAFTVGDIGGASKTSTMTIDTTSAHFLRILSTPANWQAWLDGSKIADVARTSYAAGSPLDLFGTRVISGYFPGIMYSTRIRIGVANDGTEVPSSYDLA